MKISKEFISQTAAIAVPCALQSLLQSSFGFIDQIMVGQLGQNVIAGIGVSVKFAMIFTSLAVAGLSTCASVMVSQYLGQKNEERASICFWQNLLLCTGIGFLFALLCSFQPGAILNLYTPDTGVISQGSRYLMIYSWAFPLMGCFAVTSSWLRCSERAYLVTGSAFAGAIANTLFNWLFIFVLPAFRGNKAAGAALASVLSQLLMVLLNLMFLFPVFSKKRNQPAPSIVKTRLLGTGLKTFFIIAIPLAAGEILWSLAENIYTMVYGHLSVEGLAAMTMTNPIQGAYFGILAGFGQAASILIGRRLGAGEDGQARKESVWILRLSFYVSVILALLTAAIAVPYTSIYQVSGETRFLSILLLLVFSVYSLVKVQNMVLGGGILRSGGRTSLTFIIDAIGTWCFGVPAALLLGGLWHLNIVWVYAGISFEEVVRYLLSLYAYRKNCWIQTLH